jgi:hypothetical protein
MFFITANATAGKDATEILLASQYEGVQRAVELGMVVKVNTVLIPGINEAEIPRLQSGLRAGRLCHECHAIDSPGRPGTYSGTNCRVSGRGT